MILAQNAVNQNRKGCNNGGGWMQWLRTTMMMNLGERD